MVVVTNLATANLIDGCCGHRSCHYKMMLVKVADGLGGGGENKMMV